MKVHTHYIHGEYVDVYPGYGVNGYFYPSNEEIQTLVESELKSRAAERDAIYALSEKLAKTIRQSGTSVPGLSATVDTLCREAIESTYPVQLSIHHHEGGGIGCPKWARWDLRAK